MSARETVLYLLWQSVPSSTDTEARSIAADTLDAYRSEVLQEAAALAGRSVALFEDSEECAVAAGALEGLAIRLRRMADETGGEFAPPIDPRRSAYRTHSRDEVITAILRETDRADRNGQLADRLAARSVVEYAAGRSGDAPDAWLDARTTRAAAEQDVEDRRTSWPDIRLVSRSVVYGPWTEVSDA